MACHPASDDIGRFAHSSPSSKPISSQKAKVHTPSVAFQNKMNKSPTDSSHGSTQHSKKRGQSLVLSLADQKLTVEDNENLEQFVKGEFSLHPSL
jgi:hypothetical protein